ncbi:NAD(P)-dependent alcohol dehydrogenase [Gordonia malaquae]|uniref:NAD(P)-dependent alcohol dehydrogenase n=1 Tax=Gordonia malaquae TaxID=410332 RepID=UPI0030FE76C1
MTYTRKVASMKAVLVEEYGPPEVLQIGQIPTPMIGDGQILVKVMAAAITVADSRLRAARFPRGFGILARLVFGVRRPRRAVPGSMFSGVVVDACPAAGFHIGDEVVGSTGLAAGSHAEFVAVDATRVVTKPDAVNHVDAAGVMFGGTTALHYLRVKAALADGDRVLVIGASGAVGTSAVQIASLRGAHVTAVTSAANADLVRRLGADEVVDYRVTAPTDLTGRFDVVFDTVGGLTAQSGRRLMTSRGRLLLAAATLGQTALAVGRVKAGPAPEHPRYFTELLDLVAHRDLKVVLDQVVGFDGLIEAHRRIDSGRKVGNIVLTP